MYNMYNHKLSESSTSDTSSRSGSYATFGADNFGTPALCLTSSDKTELKRLLSKWSQVGLESLQSSLPISGQVFDPDKFSVGLGYKHTGDWLATESSDIYYSTKTHRIRLLGLPMYTKFDSLSTKVVIGRLYCWYGDLTDPYRYEADTEMLTKMGRQFCYGVGSVSPGVLFARPNCTGTFNTDVWRASRTICLGVNFAYQISG